VAVLKQASEDDNTTKFLEAELSCFNNMTGTSNMAEHQITMKDDKPIKQRYYPKNPKVQGEINAKVDELLHSQQVHTAVPSCCLKKSRANGENGANQRQVYKGAAWT